MKIPRTTSRILCWVSLFLLLWVVGCSVSTGVTPEQSSTVPRLPTATKQPSITPTPTLSLTISSPTGVPSPVVLVTQSVTSVSSTTPLPTLLADEAKDIFLDLLRTNGGCRLPCWWGLTPGKTTGQEAKSFLEKFGSLLVISVHDEKGGYIQLQVPENGLILWPDVEYEVDQSNGTLERLSVSNEIVRKIEGGYETVYGDLLFAKVMPVYVLPQILSTYGQPSDVLVRGIRGWWEFDLLLSYAESGFLINYSAPYEEKNGAYFGCPSKATVDLWLWPSERNYSLLDAAKIIFGQEFGADWLSSYLSLQEATKLSPEMFYETYKEPQNTTCLETSINLWPEP